MKLKFLRFESYIEISDSYVRTLQVENRQLFARIVGALLSEKGAEAIEPYECFQNDGNRIPPRKALVVISTLPTIPYDNRTLITKLYAHVAKQLEQNPDLQEQITMMGQSISNDVEGLSTGFWGDYRFTLDWNIEGFLKAYGFTPAYDDSSPLLDNCIHFFGLLADIGARSPVALVNAKEFFDAKDLDKLLEQAIFLGVPLLLLETIHDSSSHPHERKTIIDQQFIETNE